MFLDTRNKAYQVGQVDGKIAGMAKFKVKTPSGVFAPGEWRRREDVPEILMNRREQRFFVEDGEIVEVEGEVGEPRESNGPTDLAK